METNKNTLRITVTTATMPITPPTAGSHGTHVCPNPVPVVTPQVAFKVHIVHHVSL